MRVLNQFVLATACAAAMIGCSEVTSPTMVDNGASKSTDGQIAVTPVFLELGGVDGETGALEEALGLYRGTGTETAALIVPAIQKVREAIAELEEGANRDGAVNAKDAEKKFRKLINTYKPSGNAYSIKDIFNTSAAKGKDHGHRDEIEILSYGNSDAANVEFQLHHFFNGVRMIMDDARVNDDAIDRAMDGVLAAIAVLSEERP